jgi:hypothetical protein
MTDLPKITKGSISVVTFGSDDFRHKHREFIYNPNEFEDAKETDWGAGKVPGASHPVYAFAAGGERLITFDLFIDGDRQKRPSFVKNGLIDISDEIRWYQSLLYPVSYASMSGKVNPATVVFTYGSMWRSVSCIVRKANVKINYFSSGGTPIRATISMALAEVVTKSKIYSDVLQGYFFTEE